MSYKRLTEPTRTPIVTSENLYTIWSFRNFLEIGALDVVLPDVAHTGVLVAAACDVLYQMGYRNSSLTARWRISWAPRRGR